MSTQEREVENIVGDNEASDYEQSFSEEALNDMSTTEGINPPEVEHVSNGLENFGVEKEIDLDLFNSDSVKPQDLLSAETNEDSSEDDDLEIPAFLRRQKN